MPASGWGRVMLDEPIVVIHEYEFQDPSGDVGPKMVTIKPARFPLMGYQSAVLPARASVRTISFSGAD